MLNTTHGKQVKNLLEGGVKLGISSRGFGDVKESGGARVVQSLYLVSLGDIVTNPSAPNAFVNAVMEKVDWVWENGVLVGKDISEDIDEYRDALEKSSQKDRDAVAIAVFKEYLSTISTSANILETVELDESIKSELEKVIGDGKVSRSGKLVTITWKKANFSADEIKSKIKKALSSFKDKIKFIGAEAKGGGIEAEVELA